MSNIQGISLLTPKTLQVLENLHVSPDAPHEGIRQALRRKLDTAQILLAEDMPDDVVTLGSRVAYSLNGTLALEHVLVARQDQWPLGQSIDVATPRGLAMLGRRKGENLAVRCDDRIESVRIIEVLFQPEAANRVLARQSLQLAGDETLDPRSGRPANTPRSDAVNAPYWGGDDPGPSAA